MASPKPLVVVGPLGKILLDLIYYYLPLLLVLNHSLEMFGLGMFHLAPKKKTIKNKNNFNIHHYHINPQSKCAGIVPVPMQCTKCYIKVPMHL